MNMRINPDKIIDGILADGDYKLCDGITREMVIEYITSEYNEMIGEAIDRALDRKDWFHDLVFAASWPQLFEKAEDETA
jgi:hypothetical protein